MAHGSGRTVRALVATSALIGSTLLSGVAHAAPEPVSKFYTEHGTYKFTVPAGVNELTILIVGAGGGGGGGGGNNNGPLTGGGGSGGSSAAGVRCSFRVSPGLPLALQVGKGGAGGTAGGDNTNGGSGQHGGNSIVRTWVPRPMADARGGAGGGGGEHSGVFGSGNGGAPGQPGAFDTASCLGNHATKTWRPAPGEAGHNGARNNKGNGGYGGKPPSHGGGGGAGGHGAGIIGGGGHNRGNHLEASAGFAGDDGLIEITYTPAS